MNDLDIAVLHGNYHQRGGGEHVADAIAEIFDAPLYYGFGNRDAMPDDDIERIQVFKHGHVTGRVAETVHQFRDACFMWWGQHLPELYEYDVIIQSGNEFGWFVPKDDQAIVKYVHSPPRGPYDLFHRNGSSPLHRAYCLAVKTLYRHTVTYPDVYLANSQLVAARCQKYWGVTPDVVHPPISVDTYGREQAEVDRDATFLTFSRLYRHKRTREIVEAFRELDDCTLIVGGDGPQREHLEAIAPANVEVRGYLSEPEKRRLLAGCDALLFAARNEDFGIVPIEAFASGTPVLGIDDGFTRYQIQDGKNGLLFDTADPDVIANTVRRYRRDGITATPSQLEAYASQFSRDRFAEELHAAVERAVAMHDLENLADDMDWQQPDADDEDVDHVVEPVVPDGGRD